MKKQLKFLTVAVAAVVCAAMLAACGKKDVKSDITGITFASASYEFDGTSRNILVDGTVPDGVKVAYTVGGAAFGGATEIGTYNITATLKGEKYNTLTKTATLTITENTTDPQFMFGEVPDVFNDDDGNDYYYWLFKDQDNFEDFAAQLTSKGFVCAENNTWEDGYVEFDDFDSPGINIGATRDGSQAWIYYINEQGGGYQKYYTKSAE